MPKECTSSQIRNPKTGRCVSRNGKIGKEILAGKGGRTSSYEEPKKSDKTEKLQREVKSLKIAYEKSLKDLRNCNQNFFDLKQKYEIAMQNSTHSHKQDHHSERKKDSTPSGKEKHQENYKKETEKLKEIDIKLKKALTTLTSSKEQHVKKLSEMHVLNTTVKEKEAEKEEAIDKYKSMFEIVENTKTAAAKKIDSDNERDRGSSNKRCETKNTNSSKKVRKIKRCKRFY